LDDNSTINENLKLIFPVSVLVPGCAVEENGDAEIQPQHSQGQGINGTVDIGVCGKMLHIQRKQPGKHKP
jgi:hypothetical protein